MLTTRRAEETKFDFYLNVDIDVNILQVLASPCSTPVGRERAIGNAGGARIGAVPSG